MKNKRKFTIEIVLEEETDMLRSRQIGKHRIVQEFHTILESHTLSTLIRDRIEDLLEVDKLQQQEQAAPKKPILPRAAMLDVLTHDDEFVPPTFKPGGMTTEKSND